MSLPTSNKFVWAHGGLGMQRLSHLFAPYNFCTITHNEYFFQTGPNMYCDHADHLWNEHRNNYQEPTVKKYKEMLDHFKGSKHVIIHEDGWGQYARILRILKHVLNVPTYANYEHIKVTDAEKVEVFRQEAQEIADNNFTNGVKLNSMSGHYTTMSHRMHYHGIDVYDVSYYDLYVDPEEDVYEDMFKHFDIAEHEYVNYGYIKKQMQIYHQNNIQLIKKNIPNIAEKLDLWLDKQHR